MTEPLSESSARTLVDTVIAGGYCIGCGACALTDFGRFAVSDTGHGFQMAQPTGRGNPTPENLNFLKICPHSGVGRDESEIGKALFGSTERVDEIVGYWDKLTMVAMANEDDRLKGSSGGGVTWLLRELLKSGLVDAIAHVQAVESPEAQSGEIFSYSISRSVDDVNKGRKSVYYPTSLSGVLDQIRTTPGRYAITAIPCYAKAIRLLTEQDPVLRDRIVFVVGLVCGHLKSRHFSEYLGWLAGVPPGELAAVDFRQKLPQSGSGAYAISATARSGVKNVSRALETYFGTSWELGFMKYKACEYCDDVFCETADVAFGDAWIQPYVQDWRGHNVVVSRTPVISRLIADGVERGELEAEDLTIDRVISSQAGGVRHRREGLAWRLAEALRLQAWVPRKRVSPLSDGVSPSRAQIYRSREEIRVASYTDFTKAKKLNSIFLFYVLLALPVFKYYMNTYSLKRAARETAAFKALRRTIKR